MCDNRHFQKKNHKHISSIAIFFSNDKKKKKKRKKEKKEKKNGALSHMQEPERPL
jgi:hypothetical protein